MALKVKKAGELLREGLGDGPSANRRLGQRERLIAASGQATDRRPLWVWAMAAGAVALLLAVGVFRLGTTSTEPLANVEGSDTAGTQAVRIAFEDGSYVVLAQGARGHVASNEPDAVRVVLDQGRLEASVEPQAQRTWTVAAGPFEVVVVGTAFAVEWDEDGQALRVYVTRGEVNVRGGSSLSASGVAVRAGHRLDASASTGTVTLTPTSSPTPRGSERGLSSGDDLSPGPADSDSAGVLDLGEASPDRRDPPKYTARRGQPQRRGSLAWRVAFDSGEYVIGLKAAKAHGFARLLDSLGPADLGRLADCARLAKDRERAVLAYEAARRRFPKTKVAGQAAFQLGRLHARSLGGQRKAAGLLRQYLDERPQGVFVREARGRLMQTLISLGEASAARSVAQRYLKLHPTGPHAKIAKSLLE